MKHIPRVVAWLSAGLAVCAFFMTWARIKLQEPDLVRQLRQTAQEQGLVDQLTKKIGRVAVQIRRGTETVTGELPSLSDIPRQVSGIQIPQMANQKNAQVVIALVELLTNTRQDIGFKSYAVYLVPALALLCAGLLTVLGRVPVVAIGVGVVCAGIAGAGFWKLLTTNTHTLFAAITIGQGLWLSLWAYVGLAVAAGLCLLQRKHAA